MGEDQRNKIRLADPSGDGARLLEIYALYVMERDTSFECLLPTVAQFTQRIEAALKSHAWFVYEESGVIRGYAYAGPVRPRQAYRWGTEISVYVEENHVGRGIGSLLGGKLLDSLKKQGFVTAYASIAMPNEASVKLHKKLGFSEIGRFKDMGYKNGKWIDVLWLDKRLGETLAPEETKSCYEV